ncbi:hypothetical protein [Aminobacter sp. LjRoot7]|uniref:hypothetical protein n=1 Tax=Aminobacter sp. LjRoot7 TaxID=3342335 RepID=UPI003ED0F857
MDFQPVNEDHAIESVIFTVLTGTMIDPDAIQLLVERHNKIRGDLPALSLPESHMPTAEFAYRRPDGSASWLLRCGSGNSITVECRRYTRWEKVWNSTRTLLLHAMACCSEAIGPDLLFGTPTLRVTDRFRAAKENAKLVTLLRHDPYIAEAAFELGPVFHSNVGWFDNLGPDLVLNTLNVQGRRDSAFERSTLRAVEAEYVVVEHFQQFRPPQAVGYAEATANLDRIFSTLHQRNKDLLGRILVDEMQGTIGLTQ